MTIGLIFLLTFHSVFVEDSTVTPILKNQKIHFRIDENITNPPDFEEIEIIRKLVLDISKDTDITLFVPDNSNNIVMATGKMVELDEMEEYLLVLEKDDFVEYESINHINGEYYFSFSENVSIEREVLQNTIESTGNYEVQFIENNVSFNWSSIFKPPVSFIYFGTILEVIIYLYIVNSDIWDFKKYVSVHILCGGSTYGILKRFTLARMKYISIAILIGVIVYQTFLIGTDLSTSLKLTLYSGVIVLTLTSLSHCIRLWIILSKSSQRGFRYEN